MPITGVFFVPSNPNSSTLLSTITERLNVALPDDPLIPVGRWALEHKLMRDTPSCLPASASQRPAQPRYMQFLYLSYHPVHGFVYVSEAEGSNPTTSQQQSQQQTDPATATATNTIAQTNQSSMIMSTVPLPSSATLFQHFVYACQPFWCHRHTHAVLAGLVYDVGDFRIRLGDVRQTQPVARVRGTVVEVEWRGPSLVDSVPSAKRDVSKEKTTGPDGAVVGDGDGDEDDDSGVDMVFDSVTEEDIDAEYVATAALIREFWEKLNIEGAREAILVPDVGKEVKERLHKWRQQEGKGEGSKNQGVVEGEDGPLSPDEDPDPEAGVDVARQFMEIFRFNR